MIASYADISVGDALPVLEKGPVTLVDVVRYSGAAGDFNPIHFDVDVAKAVGLDGVIIQGMLIMAYAGQALTDWAGADAVRRFKVRFSGMTFPGEVVVCEGRVTGKEVVAGENQVTGRITVKGKADGSLKLKGDFMLALPDR
jgi:acyl dehydratase